MLKAGTRGISSADTEVVMKDGRSPEHQSARQLPALLSDIGSVGPFPTCRVLRCISYMR